MTTPFTSISLPMLLRSCRGLRHSAPGEVARRRAPSAQAPPERPESNQASTGRVLQVRQPGRALGPPPPGRRGPALRRRTRQATRALPLLIQAECRRAAAASASTSARSEPRSWPSAKLIRSAVDLSPVAVPRVPRAELLVAAVCSKGVASPTAATASAAAAATWNERSGDATPARERDRPLELLERRIRAARR